jgi:leishmanolysin
MTPARLSGLNGTLESMAQYMTALLKVPRETMPITFTGVSDIPTSPHSSESDLVVAVAARPFGPESDMLAAAWSTRSGIRGRSIVGGIYINVVEIPEVPQNESSFERFFFTVVFHELMHVLGMTSSMWTSQWIDQRTGKPYSPSPVKTYRQSRYPGKSFQLLQTPALQRLLAERHGVSEFAPGIPLGLEIEDGGGGGTAGAHPESRVWGGEVMCGIFLPYVVISAVSLALLDDTGWYVVDYARAEPYPWGDGRSVLGEALGDFLGTAPQLSYPAHYLCTELAEQVACNYDFLSKGKCIRSAPWHCPGSTTEDSQACAMREFVNPGELPVRGDNDIFDWLHFRYGRAADRCEEPGRVLDAMELDRGEVFGPGSMCFATTLSRVGYDEGEVGGCYVSHCDDAGRLFVVIGNQTIECLEPGDAVEVNASGFEGYLVCPDPRLMCNMKKFLMTPAPAAPGSTGQSTDAASNAADSATEIPATTPEMGATPSGWPNRPSLRGPPLSTDSSRSDSTLVGGIAILAAMLAVAIGWRVFFQRPADAQPEQPEEVDVDL